MTWRFAQSEELRLQNDVDDLNRGIAFDLERQIGADIATLRALATTPALRDGDIASFAVQAKSLIDTDFSGAHISLVSADGYHTVLDVGRLAASAPSQPVIVPGREISDLQKGASYADSTYSITVPVIIAGTTRFYLVGNMPLARILRIIREQSLTSDHFASIVDRDGLMMARSAEPEKYLGRKIPGLDAKSPAHFDWVGVNPQRVEIFGVFRRLKFGWGVTTGISQEVLHAPLRHSLEWLAALAATMIAISFGLATIVTRALARAAQSLARKAEKLGDGLSVGAPDTAVAEANTIALAMMAASKKLRQQAEALQAANAELEQRVTLRTQELGEKTALLETTLANMDQGLVVIDQSRCVQLANARGRELIGVPAQIERSGAGPVKLAECQGAFIEPAENLEATFSSPLVPGETLVQEWERPDGTVLEVRTVPLADKRLVRTYTDITLRKHAERHLRHLARHDSLTGLPNRLMLNERLEQAIAAAKRHAKSFAVLSLDLDRFKEVNDAHGHAAGDGLLIEVASRLKSVLRAEDVVARVGGDEFIIIQVSGDDEGDYAALADRILEELAKPYLIGKQSFDISVSIGVALWPENGITGDELLECADVALYRAKRHGRNCFRVADTKDALQKAS